MTDSDMIARQPPAALAPLEECTLPIAQIRDRVAAIEQLLREVMREDVDFGRIPGCGDKCSLLKPGTELLCMMFHLAPKYEVTSRDLPDGHREYQVKTGLTHAASGRFWGEGVGLASSMESKYRYRGTQVEPTGQAVPHAYWDAKRTGDTQQMEKVLGGKEFTVKKIDGEWQICKRLAVKAENPDPADVFNTCLKMAKKRALVDAILTATGASRIFTQDMEDVDEYFDHPPKRAGKAAAPTRSAAPPSSLSIPVLDWLSTKGAALGVTLEDLEQAANPKGTPIPHDRWTVDDVARVRAYVGQIKDKPAPSSEQDACDSLLPDPE